MKLRSVVKVLLRCELGRYSVFENKKGFHSGALFIKLTFISLYVALASLFADDFHSLISFWLSFLCPFFSTRSFCFELFINPSGSCLRNFRSY